MSALSGKQVSVVGRQGRCRLILFTERLAFAEEEPVGIDRRKLEQKFLDKLKTRLVPP